MNPKIIEKMNKTLDIVNEISKEVIPLPILDIEKISPEKILTKRTDNIRDDYENTRNTLYELAKKGNDAIDKMLTIAGLSEEPRGFEVVGQLLKITSDINKELLETQKLMNNIEETKSDSSRNPRNVNNNLFVGTTKEILKMWENEYGRKKKVIPTSKTDSKKIQE